MSDLGIHSPQGAAHTQPGTADCAGQGLTPLERKLLGFFDAITEHFWDNEICEMDGGDFQDKAEAAGVIVKAAFNTEAHGCDRADEYGLADGDEWFVLSDDVQTGRKLLNAPPARVADSASPSQGGDEADAIGGVKPKAPAKSSSSSDGGV